MLSQRVASAFNDTYNRSRHLSPSSGMCSFCTEECEGSCEIALAAVIGAKAVYPTNTGNNQVASEKKYPLDFDAFNINGRVFGAQGVNATFEEAAIYNVNLETTHGRKHLVKQTMPIILPALIKLNWPDYFAGSAMAGVSCVIGEDAKSKDPNLLVADGKIQEFPWLFEILEAFNRYDRGYGQIILQCNTEDDLQGLPEYALSHTSCRALEFKFGQSAKGTQPAQKLKNLEEALKKKRAGVIVQPDPEDETILEKHQAGTCPNFYSYGRLPLWDEQYLTRRISELKEMGLENVYFKMAGYDAEDLERVLRLASEAEVDMVTFDGAGGGSGYSPCKMMNEWGLPTMVLEHKVRQILKKMKNEGLILPTVTITGGLASEDQVFKALALGDGLVDHVGLCRASMTAAMMGKNIGERIKHGDIPSRYQNLGSSIEEIFGDLADLRALYGLQANDFSPGAIGVFSYLNKIAFGLKHFCALNRKFDVKLLNNDDLIPLHPEAEKLLIHQL